MISTKNIDTPIQKLLDNIEKLSTIFNTLREIVFTIDIDNATIENVNNSIENLGYNRQDWEGQCFANWSFSKRKKFHFLIKHGSNSKDTATSKQVVFPTKDDTQKVPFEFSSALYYIKQKKYLLCVLRDVTEREQMLTDVKAALVKEKQLSELRNIFISTASHQFRTPLTIIQSGVEIMDMYVEDLSPEKRQPFQKQFNRILGEIERLQYLMNDVLLLGRADANRTPFNPKKQDLVAFCSTLINKYNTGFSTDRQIIITIQGTPVLVNFDANLLDHALENILSNAYKYSTDHNVLATILFTNVAVEIAITDKGMGIPEKDIANMFEPFFRSSNTDEVQGTGLGLAIVKEFIELHGGTIFSSSQLNKGTTITVLLPLKD